MAFTNLWDDTFPADTELANLIGSNLRQVRLDTQQRMGAISGLDAAKPAFSADPQASNWNGVLFFATDTGKVYQFNNPNWTDVTTGIASGSGLVALKDTVTHTVTGTTAQQTVSTLTGNVGLSASQGMRATVLLDHFNWVGGTDSITITMGAPGPAGQSMSLTILPTVAGGSMALIQTVGCNTNNVANQRWGGYNFLGGVTNAWTVVSGGGDTFTTTSNTGTPPYHFNLLVQLGNVANRTDIIMFSVEFF